MKIPIPPVQPRSYLLLLLKNVCRLLEGFEILAGQLARARRWLLWEAYPRHLQSLVLVPRMKLDYQLRDSSRCLYKVLDMKLVGLVEPQVPEAGSNSGLVFYYHCQYRSLFAFESSFLATKML